MAVQPPRIFHRPNENNDPLSAALQHEILGEKASTLGRLQTKLENALAALKTAQDHEPDNIELHARKLAEAGEALWYVTIQRELCGLVRHKPYYDHMDVPGEVRLQMGPNLEKHSR